MGKWIAGPWISIGRRVQTEKDGFYIGSSAERASSTAILYDCEISLANARLIAAAPEMAEMIQKMLDRSVQMDPFTEQEARALLDKVNG